MKSFKYNILSILFICLSLASCAYHADQYCAPGEVFEEDGLTFKVLDDWMTVEVSGGAKDKTEITIPYRITHNNLTYEVVGIGDEAFRNREYLRKVEIHNNILSIGKSSFSGCSRLEEVIIPNSVTTIEYGAFRECINLKKIIIPNSVTSIGVEAFYNNKALTDITYPENIKHVGRKAFDGTAWLNNQPNDTVVYIGKCAYWYKTDKKNIKDLINIKEGTLSIADMFFRNYSNYNSTSIKLPKSLVEIDDGAFSFFNYYDTYQNVYCRFENVYISDLKSYCEIEQNAEGICYGAHLYINNVQVKDTLVFSEGVTQINAGAFNGFTDIKVLVFPNSLTQIQSYAFDNISLTSIHCKSNSPIDIQATSFNKTTLSSATLYVPTGSKQAYQNANVWKSFYVIKEE